MIVLFYAMNISVRTADREIVGQFNVGGLYKLYCLINGKAVTDRDSSYTGAAQRCEVPSGV